MTRCLLADDHPGVLAAISAFLEAEGIDVVAQARDGAEARDAIAELTPDVAILDARMPALSGIDVAREVTRRGHATAVILYTGAADRALVNEGVDAGARGLVLKDAPLADLVRAIEIVRRGGTYVDAGLVGELMSGSAVTDSVDLTQRERDVLRLLADGKDYERIGAELFISPETARADVRKAMSRLEADTRTQAVATALRQALIA